MPSVFEQHKQSDTVAMTGSPDGVSLGFDMDVLYDISPIWNLTTQYQDPYYESRSSPTQSLPVEVAPLFAPIKPLSCGVPDGSASVRPAGIGRWLALGLRLIAPLALLTGSLPVQAADGYWLDQYNALLYLGTLRLDPELRQMRRVGAAVVMVHADSLPDQLLRWIAWRSRRAGLTPVAWIQRPSASNLRRVGSISGYAALQVDDHFFAAPPVPIAQLKADLSGRPLWCSFQPGQYSWYAAQSCDHVDLQLYRQSCDATVDAVYRLGVAGRSDTAVAVYHDGSDADDRRLSCFREQFAAIGNRLFVFKWKNPEHWLSPMTRRLWQVLGYLRSLQPG